MRTTLPARGAALLFAGLLGASSVLYVACDSGSDAVKEPAITPDSGSGPGPDGGTNPNPDGGTNPNPDGGPSDCFLNPATHDQIINACTDAVKITKNPTLPLQYPDGGLPPLP